MPNVLDTLRERGFVHQISDEAGLRKALEQPLTMYAGFDPSNTSYHIGNLLGIMLLSWFQRFGHRTIALQGGGTALVGDPSGKTTTRKVLSPDEIERNVVPLQRQMGRFLNFDGGKGVMLNNAGWLTELNYIEFLRDIGRHFSVNHMLAADVYKTRLETGLSFVELNYMLLQAYDFLHLHRTYGCVLQTGGSDQWSNILAGADLIRRADGHEAFVLVTPLLTTSSGQKMGKTEGGAVWLDAEQTSPYEFYQYWINTEDQDVERFLALYTYLPMDEVRELGRLKDAAIREAKERLAYEVTAIVHGKEEADTARATSRALFGRKYRPEDFAPTALSEGVRRVEPVPPELLEVPEHPVPREQLAAGIAVHELFADAYGRSRREARTIVEQGGCYFNDQPVHLGQVIDRQGLLRWGQKNYRRLVARS